MLAYSLAGLDVISHKLQEMQKESSTVTSQGDHKHSPHQLLPTPSSTSASSTIPQKDMIGPKCEHGLSLMTLSVAEIAKLTQTVPDKMEQQLSWVLNIILETTKHCL